MDLEGPSSNKVRFNVQMCKIKSQLTSKGYTGSVRNPFFAANCICVAVFLISLSLGLHVLMVGGWILLSCRCDCVPGLKCLHHP